MVWVKVLNRAGIL